MPVVKGECSQSSQSTVLEMCQSPALGGSNSILKVPSMAVSMISVFTVLDAKHKGGRQKKQLTVPSGDLGGGLLPEEGCPCLKNPTQT